MTGRCEKIDLETWSNFGVERNRARMRYKRPLGRRHTFRFRRNFSEAARAANSTRYAMLAANLVENVSRQAGATVCYIVQPLANAFLGICARGEVQQPLIGLGILHDNGHGIRRRCL